jgi:purine-binding chemotaxis protein CheW
MNNVSNANDALFRYIDSLLLEIDAGRDDRDEDSNVPTRLENSSGNVEDASEAAPNSDVLRLLLFKTAGIPLAISQACISAVVDVERAGLKHNLSEDGVVVKRFNYQGRDIHILDTRDIILPNDHPARHLNEDEREVHVLLLNDAAYGLLCDEVGARVDIGRENVEWRSQRSTRPWLAGMVKECNHALLDEVEIIDACEQMLNITH